MAKKIDIRLKQAQKELTGLAMMTQEALKKHLLQELTACGYDVIDADGFLYARGELVLLTAHMDTVHAEPVRTVRAELRGGDIVISSPQGIGGDDRAGVWCTLEVIRRLLADGIRPAVLFCEDEEIGGVGSGKFCRTPYIDELEALRYLIELDRAHASDAVFYDDANDDFHAYIERVTGYREARGSFSDIANLMPACGRSGVNLSVGYYNAHTLHEYISLRELVHTADTVEALIRDTAGKPDAEPYVYHDIYDDHGYYQRGGLWDSYFMFSVLITWYDDGVLRDKVYHGDTEEECIGQWCRENPERCWNDIVDYSAR